MTNEKDKSRLREILLAHSEGSALAAALDDLLAIVRAEEREAAFNDFTAIVKQYIGACPGDAQLQLYAALKTATERD